MKKILFLEDELTLAKMYVKKLEANDYEVIHKIFPKEIDEAAKTFQADFVILDHGIKGSDRQGSSCIPVIRKLLPNAKIFILSGYDKEIIISQLPSEEYIADEYFSKLKISPRKLIEILNEF